MEYVWNFFGRGFHSILGIFVEGCDPLVTIIFPVGISLDENLADHLICIEGDFFVASSSESQSTWV